MAKTNDFETGHGLPAKDAEALEKIAQLAREGRSPDEIVSTMLGEHPDVAEESLHAYYEHETRRAVEHVKKLMG